MGTEDILSLGGRLQKLLEKTDAEAQEIISDAQAKADEMVREAKEESERRLVRAQYRTGLDEFLKDAEAEAKKEAEKTRKDYAKQVENVKAIPEDRVKEAAELLVREVLPR
jgi:vacuolar-type H+-ATPase subunit H